MRDARGDFLAAIDELIERARELRRDAMDFSDHQYEIDMNRERRREAESLASEAIARANTLRAALLDLYMASPLNGEHPDMIAAHMILTSTK